VALHLAQKRESPRVAEDVRVDVVAQIRAVLVHEVFHPDLVGPLRLRQILVERVARTGLVGLEELAIVVHVGEHVDLIAVLPEHPVMWVEMRERVVLLGRATEVPEEPFEHVGHEVPRGAHIELEAVGFEAARASAELFVLLEKRDVRAGVGEVAGGREAAEPAADNDDGFASYGVDVRGRVHIRS